MRLVSLRRCILALGVASSFATPAAFAQDVFTPEELERESFASLQQGHPDRALALAEALMARDETDVTPHLLRARALRDMGRVDEARGAARSAWKLSKTEAEKFSSALIMAQVLSSAEKRTRAQLWLRRAVEHAPSPALAHRAKRDFKYVQQRNPWQTYLSFTLAPNSNVNNGSARETSRLNYVISDLFGLDEFDLTGASRALSGIEIGGRANTRYRFSQTATTAHDLLMSFDYRTYVLSGSARDILEDAREDGDTTPLQTGSDFAYGQVSLGYGFKKINLDGKGEFNLSADAYQSWYGGDRYTSGVRAILQQSYKVSRTERYTFALRTVLQNGQLTYDSELAEVTGTWDKNLASGDALRLRLSLGSQTASNVEGEYTSVGLASSYSLRKPIMGAALQFGLGASFRDYDVSRHDPDGREDLRISADVTAVFREIDYYGFNPSVTFSASSTVSNINLYDSNRFGLSVGIRSAF